MTQANTADAAARLREAHAASTQGAWEWNDNDQCIYSTSENDTVIAFREEDGCFIVAAHNELPAILDELARLNSRIKELENLLLGGE